MTNADAREALGTRVRARREALGLTIDQAAARADNMSPTTWSRVEAGKTVRGLTYGGVDKVLRWVPGSCTRFLHEGVEPEENAALTLPPRKSGSLTTMELIAEAHRDLDAIERELDERLRKARRAAATGDPEQMVAVVETLREIQGNDQEG